MSVISNSTVLSNFATIDRLDLLKQLFAIIHISAEVYEELQVGIEEAYPFCQHVLDVVYPFSPAGWIHLTPLQAQQELTFFTRMPRRLHRGEASCLAIAQQRGWLFLTDDKAARLEAIAQGILLSGSVGCLVNGAKRKLWTVEQANVWLIQMIEHGYRSPIVDLTAFDLPLE